MAILCWSLGLMVTFPGTLHWPAAGADLGIGGVSYVAMLTLYELWAGERLVLEKAVPWYRRPGRPISVNGIDIWRSCRFIGVLFMSFCALPVGFGRFVLCWCQSL